MQKGALQNASQRKRTAEKNLQKVKQAVLEETGYAKSEYITGIEAFSNRTDVGTFIPFMHKLELAHKQRYEEVTADAGYESLDNYLYLEANGQMSFIKPSNYEAQKTKKFRAQIGRIENMKYDCENDCFICAEGRRLYCRKVSTSKNGG